MAKWLLVVETNCDNAAREAEFNEWYNNTHFPDVLETPEFTRATRYENTEPSEGKAKFLATYEIETDNIDGFIKVHNANMTGKRAEGRVSDSMTLVSRGFYRQIGSISR